MRLWNLSQIFCHFFTSICSYLVGLEVEVLAKAFHSGPCCSAMPAPKILVLITKATNECSDEPVHLCSLNRAFTACIHKESMKINIELEFRHLALLYSIGYFEIWTLVSIFRQH